MRNLLSLIILAARFAAILIVFSVSLAHAKLNRVQEVDPGIWRGSQPTAEADFDKLEEMGIKTIINLQWDKSVEVERKRAEARGIKFINVPLVARDRPADKDIKTIFKHLLNAKNHPVFLHCHLGRDRTGMIFAFYRIQVQDWSPQKAYDEWIGGGFAYKFLRKMDEYFKEKSGLLDEPSKREKKRVRRCNLALT